jgi:ribosomal protein L11 methyltransferase
MSSNPPPSRLAAFLRFTERQPQSRTLIVGGSALALTAAFDFWLTASSGVATPVFYLLPILGFAWFLGWRGGVASTLLSALVNLVIDLIYPISPLGHILNFLYFAIICLGAARAVSAVRVMVSYYYRGEAWRGLFQKPVRVGERFVIAPVGQAAQPFDDSSIPIFIEPGLAFGTGTHPTTQICLGLLETYLIPGDRLFDLGCGTGILSIAAAKLGAASVLGVDIVPESVQTAQRNAALNNLSDKIEFQVGSLEVVQNPTDQSLISNLQFSIVVANVLTQLILDFFTHGLAATLAPSGMLIVSGIRVEEASLIRAALDEAKLKFVEQRESNGWIAIAARANALPQ